MDGSAAPTSGIVTFLLTDVVASTQLWRESAGAGAALRRQAELIQACVLSQGGVLPPDQGEGDSTLAVFARPAAALAAALDAQRALAAEAWPEGSAVRVRMAIHTGESELRSGAHYGGLALIRAARLRSLAHGGQILVSNATVEVAGDRLPDGVSFADLGTVELPGFDRAERVHQLRHPDLPAAGTRLAPLRASAATALGHWPTPLVGRERERREVGELVDSARLVTITGAGGSGKTRLAHAVAEDLADRHADGVVWVELARVSSDEQVAGVIVAACHLAETPGVSALDVLAHRLARADLLLVLDNCEHLLSACAAVVDAVLSACAKVRVLATSREPLGVRGETSWRIPSLAVPAEAETDPERVLASDAGRLFVERARAARPDFDLDASSAAGVARICRRLDGIPLALELAAARVRALSVAQLAEGLDDRFRLLTGGSRTAVARQRTLLASVEWSHDLLEPAERTLFRRLSVFASPFSLEGAEAVGADETLDRLDVFDLLARLVDKSLIGYAGDRYRMLETLRQYALERADDAGELADLRDRHLAWFRRRAAAWALEREVTTVPVLAEIGAEESDLIAALHWSIAPGRVPATDLLHPLGQYWDQRLVHEAARAISARVLAVFEPGSDAWLVALAPIAYTLFALGDLGWVAAARHALETRREEIPHFVRGLLEQALSFALAFFRPEGIEGLQRSIEASRAAGDRGTEFISTGMMAWALALNCGGRRARPLIAWLDRNMPKDFSGRFFVDFAAGVTAVQQGDFAAARARLASPSAEHSQTGQLAKTLSLQMIGLATGDHALVRDLAAPFEIPGGFGMYELMRASISAFAALDEGNLASARQRLRSASIPIVFPMVPNLQLLAEIALAEEAVEDARQLLDEIEPSLPPSGSPGAHTYQARLRALLARARGDRDEAESHARAALALAVEFDSAVQEVDALEVLALVLADAGSCDEAARLLGAAEAFRARTGYCWRYPYLRAALTELREKLDPSALEEGAGLSIDEAVEYSGRGRGGRIRPERGWEGLTPMESRVVDLVAAGLPNKEIGKKLFVSVATVKTHLVHVYAKLELRTRAELAAAAARREVEARSTGRGAAG